MSFLSAPWRKARSIATASFIKECLRVDGELLEGTLDVQFHIYDSDDLNLGTDLGFHSLEGVSISNGIVNAKLAFEAGLFDGSSRWLEVWVKEPSAASYTVIEPMIEIVAVPYALAAKTVASVAFDGDSPVNRLSLWNGYGADSFDGRKTMASQLSVNGVPVIDSNGQWNRRSGRFGSVRKANPGESSEADEPSRAGVSIVGGRQHQRRWHA